VERSNTAAKQVPWEHYFPEIRAAFPGNPRWTKKTAIAWMAVNRQ
jgi:hypothetical protein